MSEKNPDFSLNAKKLIVKGVTKALAIPADENNVTRPAFPRGPKVIRSAVISHTPKSCDTSLLAWDEDEMRKPEGARKVSVITLAEDGLAVTGTDQYHRLDTIHYIPTEPLAGYIVGYQMPLLVGTFDCQNVVSETAFADVTHIDFYASDFVLTQPSDPRNTGNTCGDTAWIAWAGFSVISKEDASVCHVKMLDFDNPPGLGGGGEAAYPVKFTVAEDTLADTTCGCDLGGMAGAETKKTAIVTGHVYVATTTKTVVTGIASVVCNEDGTITVTPTVETITVLL